MDEQNNPMMPLPSEPTPASPPATLLPKPASSMRVVWMVLVGVVVLAGAAYGWLWLYPSSPIAEQSPSPSATADPTAGWKTYTNTQYGFEIKYPGENQYEIPEVQQINDVLGERTNIRIQNFASSDNRRGLLDGEYYLEIFANTNKNGESPCYTNDFPEEIVLSSGVSVRMKVGALGGDSGGAGRISICTNTPTSAYVIITGTELKEDAKLVRQILSTFKFTK